MMCHFNLVRVPAPRNWVTSRDESNKDDDDAAEILEKRLWYEIWGMALYAGLTVSGIVKATGQTRIMDNVVHKVAEIFILTISRYNPHHLGLRR